jgi:hypothetical protein
VRSHGPPRSAVIFIAIQARFRRNRKRFSFLVISTAKQAVSSDCYEHPSRGPSSSTYLEASRMTDRVLLSCPQCGAPWHLMGHLKDAAHLYYLWCSPCSAREQDEFLAMLAAASIPSRVSSGAPRGRVDSYLNHKTMAARVTTAR